MTSDRHLLPPPPNPKVAKTKQKIEEQKMQVLVVERAQQINLQEQEIIRRERELEATIKKPAEAERYRLEKLAEAERYGHPHISPLTPEGISVGLLDILAGLTFHLCL